jgi:hypothetical protein
MSHRLDHEDADRRGRNHLAVLAYSRLGASKRWGGVVLSAFHRVAVRVVGRVLSSFKTTPVFLISCPNKHELVSHITT